MEDKGNDADALPIYHERQVKELCALHVLNNLFQKKQTFTKKELDDICIRLSPENKFFNPHRSAWGLGNYDINVLMAALHKKGYETVWFDKRRGVDILAMEHIMGLILNVPSEYRLGFIKLPFQRKHWFAIKQLQGKYINLDSKLDQPEPVGNGDLTSLVDFLQNEMNDENKQLFLVITREVYEGSLWMRLIADVSKPSSDDNGAENGSENGHENLKVGCAPEIKSNVEANGVIRVSTHDTDELNPMDSQGNQMES